MKKILKNDLKNYSDDENPVMILNHISRLFDTSVKLNSKFDKNIPQSCRFLLMLLSKYDGASQLELCERAHLSAPTVSVCLKKLEEMNLVTRTPQENDMRVYKVSLTEKGKKIDEDNINALKAVDRKAMAGLSEGEVKALTEILLKMRENLIAEDKTE